MISVILPVYNRYEQARRAILSVLFQSVSELVEIIVVDDCSHENVKDYISNSLSKNMLRNISFYRNHKNLGQALSRNLGVGYSNNDLIAFIDSDDVWIVDKLERQMKLLREMAVDMVCCNGLWSGGGLLNPIREETIIDTKNFILGQFLLLPSGWFLKKSLFEKLNGFDESFTDGWEDGDFLARAFAHGGTILFHPAPLVIWENLSNDRDSQQMECSIQARMQFFQKHRKFLNRYGDYQYRMFRSLLKDSIRIRNKGLAMKILEMGEKEFPDKKLEILLKKMKILLQL